MILACPSLAAYWPLDDPSTYDTARDALLLNPLASPAGVTPDSSWQQPDLVKVFAGDATLSVKLVGDQPLQSAAAGGSGLLAGGLPGNKALELWCKPVAPGGSLINHANIGISLDVSGNPLLPTLTIGQGTQIGLTTSQLPMMIGWDSSTSFRSGFAVNLNDGNPHHVILILQPGVSNGSQLWVDAVQIGTWTSPADFVSPDLWTLGSGYQGWLQHVAVYSPDPTAHRIRQHWRVGNGFEIRPSQSVVDSFFVPNGFCPLAGSFNIKDGYTLYYDQLLTNGGIVTSDPTYLEVLRQSGFFTESVAS